MNGAASPQVYSTEDLDLIEEQARREARLSFWAYRRMMNPKMAIGWFQADVCRNLDQFYEDLKAGERPILIISSPPQHGKSEQVTDFISWVAGKNPQLKTIFGSYSDALGIRTNLRLQRFYDSAKFQGIFEGTRINTSNVSVIGDQKRRNHSILEYMADPDNPDDNPGYFRNTTVGGPITGEGLDLGVVDDPIKGAKEARSEVQRDSTYSWLIDDFMSRFSDKAGMIMTLTRWNLDDPAGRLINEFEEDSGALKDFGKLKVLTYPALALKGAKLMEQDPRKPGSDEPLFAELKSKGFLLSRQALSTKQSFSSIYQQSPTVYGGGLFLRDKFQIIDHKPAPDQIESSIRYWDKAGTSKGGCFTAGVQMLKLRDGRYCVNDVQKDQLSALDREELIKQTATIDGTDTAIWVEQEPGSGGKESAEATIRGLAGYNVHADKVTGDKETRADPYAAQQQGGNILLVRGEWNRAFMSEHADFPNGKYKDQVDAAGGAFAKLSSRQMVSASDFHFFGQTTKPDF